MDEKSCPRCREWVKPVPIVYGYPSAELFEQAERGELRLGGCMIGDESPDYACSACDALLPYVNEDRARARVRARLA